MIKEKTKGETSVKSLCGVCWPDGTKDKSKVDCPDCLKLMG